MDEQAQKAGETQVRRLLIEPLERLGLMRPGGMKQAAFADMQHEVCKRLAYMSGDGLGALCEDMAGRGGGKDRDRFPIAARILERALVIEKPPGDDAGPLVRKVFAGMAGQSSLDGGWAPELMAWLTTNWKWPGDYLLTKVAESARENIRRAEVLERRISTDGDVGSFDLRWLEKRRVATERCRNARALGLGESGRMVGGSTQRAKV